MTDVQVLSLLLEVVAGLGVITSLFLIWVRIAGLHALRQGGRNGDARYVSLSDLRSDLLVFLVFAGYLCLAVVAHVTAFAGAAPHSALERWALANAGIVLRLVVIGSAVVLLIKTVWKVRDWEYLTGLSWPDVVWYAVRRDLNRLGRRNKGTGGRR